MPFTHGDPWVPWEVQVSVKRDNHMKYMPVTWIPSIYPLFVSIYTSTMDPSWDEIHEYQFGVLDRFGIPSGKLSHNYGKSPCFIGKSTIAMAIFNSYVKLPGRVLLKHHCLKIAEPLVQA